MPRPLVLAAIGVFGSVFALTLGVFASGSCSGCGGPQKGSALLQGDSGACSTVETAHLPDGGYSTSFVPCDFGKVTP